MENDLNRSLRILDAAISTKDKSLIHSTAQKVKQRKDIDFSLTLTPIEAKRLELQKTFFSDISLSLTAEELKRLNVNRTTSENTFYNIVEGDRTLTGSILQANKPWTTAAENLYVEFFETLQSHSQEDNTFNILSDLAGCCSDALNVVRGIKSKITVQGIPEESWLEKERNIWRLLVVLMQDRLMTRSENMDDESNTGSEKICVLNLFKHDSLLRECQLVIDWLEVNASEREDVVYHFTDNNSVGWENTLHQLESPETIVFESSRKIINRLDPDAPHYQKLPLHDIDQSDEDTLCRKMFSLIRCGKLEEAQKICAESGHSWRAALLEGWRLYHDPNICKNDDISDTDSDDMKVINDEVMDTNLQEIKPVEGNKYRDVWKSVALEYCEKEYLNPYEKAAVAAYCGHLESLITVCKTWEDCLWAYIKVLVDIRVESELRDSMPRTYSPLKDEYWEQRMSLNEVFDRIESSSNDEISKKATLPDYKIQKYIILDDMVNLLDEIDIWVEDECVSTQFLRFAAHLILLFDELGLINDRSILNKCVKAYIDHLCELKETQLIAYYVSKLDINKQVDVYASYLEQITEDLERREALKFGENCGLDTLKVTKQVVYNIRNKPHEISEGGDLQEKATTADALKISALDWLLIYDTQRFELLEECNALLFMFLTMGKVECAKVAFGKVPADAVDSVLADQDLTSSRAGQVIREHLSYKTYLDSQDAFTLWFEQYNSKPLPPGELHENAQFTEKVAHQHRVSQFKAETERWKLSSTHLAKAAKTLLYNVLLFPEGWLTEAKDASYMRSKVIPECALLLYTVLYESGHYEECIQLADVIASEKHGLYKAYSKEKLGEFLIKLGESSVALLNERKDPWGQDTSV